MASSIALERVHAAYGAVRVLEDVSLTVNSGETVVRRLAPGDATTTDVPSGTMTVFVRRFLSAGTRICNSALTMKSPSGEGPPYGPQPLGPGSCGWYNGGGGGDSGGGGGANGAGGGTPMVAGADGAGGSVAGGGVMVAGAGVTIAPGS